MPYELLENLAHHLTRTELKGVKERECPYLSWACGMLQIDPCNGSLLIRLAHKAIEYAHEFKPQVCHNNTPISERWE